MPTILSAANPDANPAAKADSTTAVRRFTLWAIEQLALELTEEGAGRYLLALPQEAHRQFDDQPRIQFTFDQEIYAQHASDDLELVAPGGRLLSWLIDEVRKLGNVAHASPADQPGSVPEITSRLFPAYQVDGGQMRLAGCLLEDRLVLRLTFRLRLEGLEPRDELFDVLLGNDGQPLASDAVAHLGLDAVTPVSRTPRIVESELQWLMETGIEAAQRQREQAERRAAEELAPRRALEQQQLSDYFAKTRAEIAAALDEELSRDERVTVEEQLAALDAQLQRRLATLEERYAVQGETELVATTLIWCKRAAGKLRFTIGSQGVDLAFDDWARTLSPPPLVTDSGRHSYHIAATDDGRITAAEEIETCAVSGRRVLAAELLTCDVTGKRALAEYFSDCPVTGEKLLTAELVVCPECRQQVSPHAVEQGRCTACRLREPVSKTDPRLARLFDEHRALERWRNWSLSETATVYDLTAAGLVKRLLLVVDKRSLEVLHLASGTRFSGRWHAEDPSRFDQVVT
jgi:hypothetical protein